jgi:hypothetical protein
MWALARVHLDAPEFAQVHQDAPCFMGVAPVRHSAFAVMAAEETRSNRACYICSEMC